MSDAAPYLNSRISLISNAGIRYEGILYDINVANSTLALSQVSTFGTENRQTDRPVKPRDEVYEFIVFRGSDIMELQVCGEPVPAEQVQMLNQDPAIVTISKNMPPPHSSNFGQNSQLANSAPGSHLEQESSISGNIINNSASNFPSRSNQATPLLSPDDLNSRSSNYNMGPPPPVPTAHRSNKEASSYNHNNAAHHHNHRMESAGGSLNPHHTDHRFTERDGETAVPDNGLEIRNKFYPPNRRHPGGGVGGGRMDEHYKAYNNTNNSRHPNGFPNQGHPPPPFERSMGPYSQQPSNQHQRRGAGQQPNYNHGYNYRGHGNHSGSAGSGGGGNHSKSAGGNPAPPPQFNEEYDFESANAKIAEELAKMNLAPSQPAEPESAVDHPANLDDSSEHKEVVENVQNSNEEANSVCPDLPINVFEGSDLHQQFYNKKKSFFDAIGSESVDRAKGVRVNQLNRRDERKMNEETFGGFGNSQQHGGSGAGSAGKGGGRGGHRYNYSSGHRYNNVMNRGGGEGGGRYQYSWGRRTQQA